MTRLNLKVLDDMEKHEREKLCGVLSDHEIEKGFKMVRDGMAEHWSCSDIEGVLMWLDNIYELTFVFDNHEVLQRRGLYEKALINAYQDTRGNFISWSPKILQYLFNKADPDKLRAAGDPIPKRKEYVLFRGVAGIGRARRVNGMSWTESFQTALWFAKRYELKNPAVFTISVQYDDILAYLDGRNEAEYLLRTPLPTRPAKYVAR